VKCGDDRDRTGAAAIGAFLELGEGTPGMAVYRARRNRRATGAESEKVDGDRSSI